MSQKSFPHASSPVLKLRFSLKTTKGKNHLPSYTGNKSEAKQAEEWGNTAMLQGSFTSARR